MYKSMFPVLQHCFQFHVQRPAETTECHQPRSMTTVDKDFFDGRIDKMTDCVDTMTDFFALSVILSILPSKKSLSTVVMLRGQIMHKVFVYGTLKRGEPNHYWLQDVENGVGKFLAEGITKTKYPLIIATKYNIPFLLQEPGEGYNIEGEVYEVDNKMLGKLDILEEHPNYYVREKNEILTRDDQAWECWVYFLKNFKRDLLQRPRLVTYSSTGPHGLVYMDRSQRDPTYDYKSEI